MSTASHYAAAYSENISSSPEAIDSTGVRGLFTAHQPIELIRFGFICSTAMDDTANVSLFGATPAGVFGSFTVPALAAGAGAFFDLTKASGTLVTDFHHHFVAPVGTDIFINVNAAPATTGDGYFFVHYRPAGNVDAPGFPANVADNWFNRRVELAVV